jgi:trimethylamine--corrinoid protein Co-methyltransferase
LPALAGADELSGIGEMEAGVMGSYVQMVIDNEIAASVRRIKSGIQVDSDALAFEVIANVMAGARNYLGEIHSARYLRSGELLIPRLAGRQSWDEWEAHGREDMVQRAQIQAQRLLDQHQVAALSPDQEEELDHILWMDLGLAK